MDGIYRIVSEAIKLRKLHHPEALMHTDIEYDGEYIDLMFVVNGKVVIEVFESNLEKGQERFIDLMTEWILHEKEVLNDED